MAEGEIIKKRTRRTVWLVLLLAVVCFCGPVSCLDFGVENETFICRGNHECVEGYTCLRGPGGHCVCMVNGSTPNYDYADPTCLNVRTD